MYFFPSHFHVFSLCRFVLHCQQTTPSRKKKNLQEICYERNCHILACLLYTIHVGEIYLHIVRYQKRIRGRKMWWDNEDNENAKMECKKARLYNTQRVRMC